MAENIFTEKDRSPDEEQIEAAITSYQQLQQIRKFIRDELGQVSQEWKYYGKKNGWVLKTLYKKRNLFFIHVNPGQFNISFVFGQKAVAAVLQSEVAQELREELQAAYKYAEGRTLTIEVRDDGYLPAIKQLILIKLGRDQQ